MRRAALALAVVALACSIGCNGLLGIDDPRIVGDAGGADAPSGSGSSSGADAAEAGAPQPPSCAPGGNGLTDCGGANESCCASLEVKGGSFFRTYTNSGSGPTGEDSPASVSTFRLDKYEVTVGRYRQFVAAWERGWVPPAGSGKHTHVNGGQGLIDGSTGEHESGWNASDDGNITLANLACSPAADWSVTPGTYEGLPVNCVSWYEAYAFCIWDGGFLPSAAEWEYAAAGGGQQREYPWGSAPPGTASQYAVYDCDYPTQSGSCASSGAGSMAPVGTAGAGASVWGQLDMAGNVDEWNLDYMASYTTPCIDCAAVSNPVDAAKPYRVERGGAYSDLSAAALLPPAMSNDSAPTDVDPVSGFRCARVP